MKTIYHKVTENYAKSKAEGRSTKVAVILCLLGVFGFLIGYLGSFAVMGAIIMGLWNLFAPMLGCAFVFSFWHGVGVVAAWKILKAIIRALFTH